MRPCLSQFLPCCCMPHMFPPSIRHAKILLACLASKFPNFPILLLLLLLFILDPHKFSSFGTDGNFPMKIGDKVSLFLPSSYPM